MHLTVFVLGIGVGSALEQLQGTQSLSSIASTVQRSVAQQICAVDIRRFLLAELQQTHTTGKDKRSEPLLPYYSALLRFLTDRNWNMVSFVFFHLYYILYSNILYRLLKEICFGPTIRKTLYDTMTA